jgi:hypothetical protein
MKRPLLIICLLSGFLASAQTITIGSLYNFSVGDSIVSEHFDYLGNTYTHTAIYSVVMQKSTSPNQDTLYYTVFKSEVTQVPGYSPSVHSGSGQLKYGNLTDTVTGITVPATDTCGILIDTTFINSCGNRENYTERQAKTTSLECTFEAPVLTCRIVEGVGIFKKSRMSWTPSPGTEDRLITYHKAGQSSCGRVGIMPTGIFEDRLEKSSYFTVFPNPASESCEISFSNAVHDKNATVELKNILGEPVLKEKLNDRGHVQLNTSELKPGVYFIQLYQNGAMVCDRKLIVN